MSLSASVLARLQYQHETVNELIAGLDEDQLKRKVIPGKWSAFENIVHLVSYQPVFIERLGVILTEESPLFGRYIAENDPLFDDYLQKPLQELLIILVNDRLEIIRVLEAMNEEQLNRVGRHPKFGAFSISRWANLFLLHEAHHLWTILQLISV
jgi:DinB superfamily